LHLRRPLADCLAYATGCGLAVGHELRAILLDSADSRDKVGIDAPVAPLAVPVHAPSPDIYACVVVSIA
jgi:hypothetical protein